MKKKRLLVVFGIIAVIVLIVILWRAPRDYEIQYEVQGYEVSEFYDREFGYYSFSVSKDDIDYSMTIESKYLNKKKLIQDVRIYDEEDVSCVLMESSKLDEYPICYKDDEYLDYGLVDVSEDFFERESLKKLNFDYEGIEFKNVDSKDYYIWDYKGYYHVNEKTKERIDFLNKESYYNILAYSTGEYLITPNYDQDYAFTEMFVIDMKSGKLSTWKLDQEISFNSYYLGEKDGLVYLIDRKNKCEYELDPGRKRIERVDKDGMGKVWDSKWSEVSMVRLSSDDYIFSHEDVYKYILDDKRLSLSSVGAKGAMLVSDKSVDKIVANNGSEVFYLVKDELYMYSLKYGENLVLKYSELNFNNLNSVFVY